jgi:hypothetical protein
MNQGSAYVCESARVCACMYRCTHACISVRMVHEYALTYVCVRVRKCAHWCAKMRMYLWVHTCVCICAWVCAWMHMYVWERTSMYMYMPVCTCVHEWALECACICECAHVCACVHESAPVCACVHECAPECTCMCGSARVCACEHECAPESAGLCRYALGRAGVCWGVHTGGRRSSSMSTEILHYTWVSFAQQMFWERLLGGGCRDPKIKLQIKHKNIEQIDRARPKRSHNKSTWAQLCATWWQHVCAHRSVARQIRQW